MIYPGFSFITTNPQSMNPRLLCDLYEPWTCMFHPLATMTILAHPEGSGLQKYRKIVHYSIAHSQYKIIEWPRQIHGHGAAKEIPCPMKESS